MKMKSKKKIGCVMYYDLPIKQRKTIKELIKLRKKQKEMIEETLIKPIDDELILWDRVKKREIPIKKALDRHKNISKLITEMLDLEGKRKDYK